MTTSGGLTLTVYTLHRTGPPSRFRHYRISRHYRTYSIILVHLSLTLFLLQTPLEPSRRAPPPHTYASQNPPRPLDFRHARISFAV
jgi:hypothetical protein